MAMRGHNLVWASTDTRNPPWVNTMTNFTQLEEFMLAYVTHTVETIGEYPFAWDAINEAISDHHNETIKTSPWSNIPDFSCKIFKAKNVL
jgi:GH35 family endo-1,4-beta-xylanase